VRPSTGASTGALLVVTSSSWLFDDPPSRGGEVARAGGGKVAGGMVLRAGVYILVENGYLFPPSEIYIFPPSTQSVRVEKLLHGLRGKKLRHRGKNMILCPLWPAFFSKFPIIL